MSNYAYEAVNSTGMKCRGMLEVATQNEALQRLKDMGLFPTRVVPKRAQRPKTKTGKTSRAYQSRVSRLLILGGRVKPAAVAVFTRQLATLIDAGMPLLRGLRILEQQEANPSLKQTINELGASIEGGSTLSEALTMHPKVFNKLYVNMVKAGEVSGAMEMALLRLADFQEKAQRIKSKISGAMFYPIAVMIVAAAIMAIMMIFVLPSIRTVFEGFTGGKQLPAFTRLVFGISDVVRHHALLVTGVLFGLWVVVMIALRTSMGRYFFDGLKLHIPVFGKILRSSAIARFARTLGTLLGSGVPVLQALTIVKETAGNEVMAKAIGTVHDCVKEGDGFTEPLRATRIFPPMIVGMVDVGEQTGALPDLLLKVADECDNRVDTAIGALMSLLEPVMIVFLAIVVGSIVIATFLPILDLLHCGFVDGNDKGGT